MLMHEMLHIKERNIGAVASKMLDQVRSETNVAEIKLEKLYAQEELLKELLETPFAPTRHEYCKK